MSNKCKTLLLMAGLIAVIAIAGIFLVLWTPPTTPPPALPMPNGYSAFVQAAGLIRKDTPEFATLNQQQLRVLVEGNTNALQITRTGLSEKAQVPLEFSTAYGGNHISELQGLKGTAQAFLAESKLAEMENRPSDAAQSSLDAIRLGIACRRGGTLIDALVGIAIEAMGTAQLQHFVNSLDAKSCRDIAQEMENLDAQKQSWKATLDQEHYWSRQTFPGVQYAFVRLFVSSQTKAAEAKGEKRFNAQQIKTRQLMIDLAIRAFQLDKGHKPGSVTDLVPNYLKTIPQEPGTKKDLQISP